ncbi:hypothetical protein B4110_1550 [Parageobacillus toebii]|uniref:Transposase DDE domain-containing protein n=1 Tax=Parageobacillus toebii TaxID=153151 RepID=A0A150MJR0_9BACL|nr:hypothetical protein B4110_1550 [Parageobacillus toebii]
MFGQIKHNQQFQRFLLRGLPKITVEWRLICAAHNLRKWAATTDPTKKKQHKNSEIRRNSHFKKGINNQIVKKRNRGCPQKVGLTTF